MPNDLMTIYLSDGKMQNSQICLGVFLLYAFVGLLGLLVVKTAKKHYNKIFFNKI